jgi:membrane associated rhomboid family serine protease
MSIGAHDNAFELGDPDPLLRRLEQNAVIACGVMAVIAAAVSVDRVGAAAGVVAGGALAWISYRGIKGGIDALVRAVDPVDRPPLVSRAMTGQAVRGLVKFFTRYGILAAVAYVIMARLRLPPVAVFAGASSLVIAIMLEAGRSFRHNSPRNGDGSKSR